MADFDEFHFIKSQLSKLSQGADGAADLRDDGAILSLGPGERLAVTADALVQGRHFPNGENPSLAARKALRVNLSDLAAMGARPFAYTASVVWPEDQFDALSRGFVEGLARDQAEFAVRLIGGDTVVAAAPWSIAITAFGRLPSGASIRRHHAKPGDLLVVTGTIGDAGLGLKLHSGAWAAPSSDDAAFLNRRFQLPEPRISVGLLAREFAHAAIDVSDGLLSETRHLAEESGLSANIDLDTVPLSGEAETWVQDQDDKAEALLELAASGDDYELLFALPPDRSAAFIKACTAQGVRATMIGALSGADGESRVQVEFEGRSLTPRRYGFTQF